jgi:hypothetical protein
MAKYKYRQSIEELYNLTNKGKDISKIKTIDEFIKLASSFGDNEIQGKTFGENFFDFLFIECGSSFNIEAIRPATEDEDVKHGFDVLIKVTGRRKWYRCNYKFLADRFGKLPFDHLQGLMKVANEEPKLADSVCLVTNTVKLPFQIKDFKWLKITIDQWEQHCTPTFFNRFSKWIISGENYWDGTRKTTLKKHKSHTPYTHQAEMRQDNAEQFLTNMAFQGAGKTDDQTESILKSIELKPGANIFVVEPFLGLADQNSFEHLVPLLKKHPNLKILNYSSSLDWRIADAGFEPVKLSMEKDKDKWLEYMNGPCPTYSIGTYAGLPRYVKNIISNKVNADFVFDEAASLVPGQQIHTVDGLKDESILTKSFTDLVEYQHETGGRMHYWEAVNMTSFDPNAIAFGNEHYFGSYAGNGPYDLQYGIDNHIIADIEVNIVQWDIDSIKAQFPEFKEDDRNIIDAYCLQAFNKFLKETTGYYKTISYLQSASNCEPLTSILKKHTPQDFFASIVGETRQKERQKFLKAFGKAGINASLQNFLCLTLGISENSANGVFMSRNMSERLLSHSINRCTRRHPDDKPYAELVKKPVGYTGFGVDINDSASLLQNEMFKQQIYKLVGQGLDPKITIIDGSSTSKDDSTTPKNDFVYDSVASLTGDEKLKRGVEKLIQNVKYEFQRNQMNTFNKTMNSTKDFTNKMAIFKKALETA